MSGTLGKKLIFVTCAFAWYLLDITLKGYQKQCSLSKKWGGGVVGKRPVLGKGDWDAPTPLADGFCDCGFCSLPYLLEDADVP